MRLWTALLWWMGCGSSPDGPGRPDPGDPAHTGALDTYIAGPTDTQSTPVSSDTGAPVGTLSLSVAVTDGPIQPLERVFDVITEPAADLVLACTSPSDALEDHQMRVSGVASHRFVLHGLLIEHTYDCVVTATAGDLEQTWSGSFTTEHPGFRLPPVTPLPTPGRERYGHYTLFNHWNNGGSRKHKLVIVDPEGQVRWVHRLYEANSAGIEATWLGDRVLIGGGRGVNPMIMDLSGGIDAQMPLAYTLDPVDVFHHEAIQTPGGDLFGIAREKIPWAGGATEVEIFTLSAWNPMSGEYTFTWTAESAIESGQLSIGSDLSDPFHANAAIWADDSYGEGAYVSMKGQNSIIRIDRNTGVITHNIGVNGGFTLLEPDGVTASPSSQWFYGQHAPRLEGDVLSVFDNGTGRPGGKYTRAVWYEIDLEARTLVRQKSWTRADWYEPFYGEVQALPNGHHLITSGHCHDCNGTGGLDAASFIVEVDDQTGEVVWELAFDEAKDGIYRADLIEGCALFSNRRYCPEAGSAP